VKIGVAAGESVEGWSHFVIHIRGWNGEKRASQGNDNVENRDENDMTNLPESIHICPLLDQQPHYNVVTVGS
jgi:hypothetical protein